MDMGDEVHLGNFKFGLAVFNSFALIDGSTGSIISLHTPIGRKNSFLTWWTDAICPKWKKKQSKTLLPMFLYWSGAHIVHEQHTKHIEKRDRFSQYTSTRVPPFIRCD